MCPTVVQTPIARDSVREVSSGAAGETRGFGNRGCGNGFRDFVKQTMRCQINLSECYTLGIFQLFHGYPADIPLAPFPSYRVE